VARPLLISMGDPAGIGPEVIAKAWKALKDEANLQIVVIGDAELMRQQGIAVTRLDDIATSDGSECLRVLDRPLSAPVRAGHPDSQHARHIIDWIREAVTLCLDGSAGGLITAPINKSVLYAAGFGFPGHTEYLEDLTRNAPFERHPRGAEMLLMARDVVNKGYLRVVLATIHLPLREVAGQLTAERLYRTIRITHQALRADFGIDKPRLVVAGLNPHAGEAGTIGREDIELLVPLVDSLRDEMDISGPYPADSLFHAEARTRYDAAICMYHDQGLIPLKSLDFWGGVNVTLGLPIIRTSPDHGTGFDIAGLGLARAESMVAAILAARDMTLSRTA